MHRVVAEERELLARIAKKLTELAPSRAPSEGPILRELERLRSDMISREDAKDTPAQMEQFHRESAILRQLQASREAPSVDPRSPYFAHLRLKEDGEERDLCLGRATCIEGGLRIVDWRHAPLSRIFYRYDQGDEYEEEIAGRTREGEVVARRLVRIREGVLERVQSPEGDFSIDPDRPESWTRSSRARPRLAGGEATAVRAQDGADSAGRRLGTHPTGSDQRADKRLPEITGLIDPDQFALITRPSSGFLVIRGTAGSGKTTVALHRVAYLAFDDADVDSRRTLVIVFSKALASYVGHLLPSLGLEHVRILTFEDWALDQSRRHFPKLPAERAVDAPTLVQRIKLHPALGVALAEQVARVEGPSTREQALDDFASALTQQRLLEKVFEREAPGVFSTAEVSEFVRHHRRRNEDLSAWLEGDKSAQLELEPEDDALLLRTFQLRVGPLEGRPGRPLRYRHVVIDEVQDFSPLEVQVLLGCLDERRSITLAGDTHQHVSQHSGFTSWDDFFGRLGVEGQSVETLRVSYRSSQEIMDFALSVLGDLREDDEPPTATRSGPPVELFRFGDYGSCMAFLLDALRDLATTEPLASVVILTPSRELSTLYFRHLERGSLPMLRQVTLQDFTFSPGIEVTEIQQVKGLEFDYVLLVDVTAANFPDTPEARRLLHVGATRAIHQLWMLSVGTPSPLVEGVQAG